MTLLAMIIAAVFIAYIIAVTWWPIFIIALIAFLILEYCERHR